jgi:hypothetical protein
VVLFGLSYLEIAIGVAIFVVTTLLSTGAVAAFLVMIPADHFVAAHKGVRRRIRSPVVGVLYAIGKNLLGVALVVVGVLLSVPGVPGQGLLTIMVGIFLLDIPGKRRFELALVKRPAIRAGIDKLRARFDKPPMLVAAPRAQRDITVAAPRDVVE